eukprot:TRINITY_DN5416_c0_g2_i2.p1 TRINITY_DN5416_c0_g2~~TRINITY_DN5416_c0_g2_i2.p1  ORF type:complete len:202 (-),score=36.19 TRINITY_DN5416_c0_g2_i2:156-761(-)
MKASVQYRKLEYFPFNEIQNATTKEIFEDYINSFCVKAAPTIDDFLKLGILVDRTKKLLSAKDILLIGRLDDAKKNQSSKKNSTKWKDKIHLIMQHSTSDELKVWNPTKIENAHKLFLFVLEHNLVKLRYITNNVDLVINQLPFVKSIMGTPELNEEGLFWQEDPNNPVNMEPEENQDSNVGSFDLKEMLNELDSIDEHLI